MLLLTPARRGVPRSAVLVAARTVPPAVVAVAAVAALPTFVVAATGGDDFKAALFAASLVAGAGAGYAVDDAAAVILAPSPSTLTRRRALRAVPVVGVLVAAWLAALAAAAVASRGGLPGVGQLAAELVAAGAISIALASRSPEPAAGPGFGAATGAFLTMVVIAALAGRFTFLPTLAGGPHHDRWWWVATAAAVATVAAWRDPAAGPLFRRQH